MQTYTKIVRFDIYCPICKNAKYIEINDPCSECLANPSNINSHKPVNFEEKVK